MSISAAILGLELNQQENSLARRLAAGDPEALDELVLQYQDRVARLTQRLLGWRGSVEDAVQDVFLDALVGAKHFRGDCSL